MALLFSDDFNRANGPLGGAWVTPVGSWSINANRALPGAAPSVALNPVTPLYPDHTVRVLLKATVSSASLVGVVLRSDLAWSNCYYCALYRFGGITTQRAELRRRVGGSESLVATFYGTPDAVLDHELTLSVVGTRLRIYVDGNLIGETNDTAVAGGSYVGMYSIAALIPFDDFYVWDAIPTVLSVIPNYVQQGSSGNVLTLTSTAGGWTPGIPGSPTFTADVGTITSQEVLTPTTAELIYSAPGWPTVDTLRDPLNGDSVLLGISMLVSGGQLSDDAVAMLDSMGAAIDPFESAQIVVALLRALGLWPDASEYDLHGYLETILSNLSSPTFGLIALKTLLDNAIAGIVDTDTQVRLISENGTYVLLDVLNAIAGIPPCDLTPVLNELAVIRGFPQLTLVSLQNQLDEIQTVADLDLQDILDAISAFPGCDLTPVLNAIAAIRTGSNYHLGDVIAAISAVRGAGNPDLAAILTAISDVRGSGNPDLAALVTQWSQFRTGANYTVQSILDALAGISVDLTPVLNAIASARSDILTAVGNVQTTATKILSRQPIRWPGLAGVTLGTPVDLTSTAIVAGPMSGAIVALTATPARVGYWGVPSMRAYYHCGHYSFLSPEGHAEDFRFLTWTSALVIPQTMLTAGSLLVHLRAEAECRVTPWTLNP